MGPDPVAGGSNEEAPDCRGRCAHCGDVIGVYAPAVWATDDGRVVTASPLSVNPRDLRPSVAAHVHLDCWNRLIGRAQPRREPGTPD